MVQSNESSLDIYVGFMSACQHLRCLLHPGQDEDCACAGMHQMMGDADLAYALTELSEDIC